MKAKLMKAIEMLKAHYVTEQVTISTAPAMPTEYVAWGD
jgi:hypothetical protein